MIVSAQNLLYVSHKTKPRNPPDLSCCWVLLDPAWPWCCSLPQRMESFPGANTALTLPSGSFRERCFFSGTHIYWKLLQPRLAMVWKTGVWTSYDEFQKAKMGMCSVLVRSRDLLGSRNCVNLDSKMEISAGRPGRAPVLTICIVHP